MLKDDSGKLVLESAVLFPAIIMITVLSLFVALASGLQGVALTAADQAASRMAFNWDNSHRNPITGAFFPGQFDPLYWRLTSDHAGSRLTNKKLSTVLDGYSGFKQKDASFAHALWRRKTETAFAVPLRTPDLLNGRFTGERTSTMTSAAVITDPAEWVRAVDMVKLYWPIVTKSLSRAQADQMVEQFALRTGVEQEILAFESHDLARDYMRELVGGRESKENTTETGHWRLIDGLDRHGIAHQTMFGARMNDKKTREQYLKDAELMRKGKVNGVTWHFFRKKKDDSIGPTPSLRRELEKRGIVIVIHE